MLIALLGALSAFGPVITDVYLPALPEAAAELHTSPAGIQTSLAVGLIGLAVGQLVVGPLSDVVGRRRPMLVGMAVFTLASALCAVAGNIYLFTACRLLQGLGGGTGIVLSLAIVRDLYQGRESARAFSILMSVGSVAPILAPIVGAQVLRVADWRVLFVGLGALGLVYLGCAWRWIAETLPPENRRHGNRFTLTVNRPLLAMSLVGGLPFAAMFAYISASPFVFASHGVSPQLFAVLFAVNGAGLLLAGVVNARLMRRYTPRRVLTGALLGAVAGSVGTLTIAVTDLGLAVLMPCLFVMVTSVGFAMPNATALALEPHAADAGGASALIGLVKYALGAAIAPLSGLGSNIALTMAILTTTATCAALALSSRTSIQRVSAV